MAQSSVTRRAMLSGLGALGLWPWPGAGLARTPRRTRVPPTARIEPVSETHWGEVIVDPYRWMENPADPDWLPFMRGQAAYARGVLDAAPGRASLARRIAALSNEVTGVERVQRGRVKDILSTSAPRRWRRRSFSCVMSRAAPKGS